MKENRILLALLAMVVMFWSCQNDDDLDGSVGYLRLSVGTVVSTNTTTKVATDYKPKQLYVEIVNASGTVVKSTTDFATWADETITLKEGTYTINASSYNFDGSESGFDIPYYAGTASVTITKNEATTAEVVCSLANVKVSTSFDASLDGVFESMSVVVKSALSGVNQVAFSQTETRAAYFPVGGLTVDVAVLNKDGMTHSLSREITGVKARDHYQLNFRLAESGNGSITVEADDTERTFTYTFDVPTKAATKLQANTPNAWGSFAYLSGEVVSKVADLPIEYMKFEWQQTGASGWNALAVETDGEDKYKATLRSLTPSTQYSYRLAYNDGTDSYVSDSKTFTTGDESALPNGNMDDWYQSDIWYPISVSDYTSGNLFWDTSNKGTSLINKNITTGVSSPARSGYAAKLQSINAVIKFAAASLYSGEFGGLQGTKGAKINFGRPFTARPTALKGWFQYSTSSINYPGSNLPANSITDGQDDLWSAYVVLTTGTYTLDNTDMAGTSKDFNALLHDDSDEFVVGYGVLPDAQCVSASDWTSFEIPIVYKNQTTKPTHIIIVFSSSKYGDYFAGSDSSVLYLDDLELVYGEPTLK